MFCYTALRLDTPDRTHLRLYLAAAGIVSVAMGMAVALGISSLLGPATAAQRHIWLTRGNRIFFNS